MNKEEGKILVELQEWMGSDESIANAAWTSTYDKDRREDKYDDPDKVDRIVRMLIQDGHSVPVESVVMRFWIRMPIFTDRQHMTHRLASHNGLSGRYRTMPSDYFKLPKDVKDIFKKAGADSLIDVYQLQMDSQWTTYNQMIQVLKDAEKNKVIKNPEFKRCREVVRGVLGTSFMVERTSIFNLRSFGNYMMLRRSDHAQPEIKQVAELMYQAVIEKGIAPIAIEELEKKGWKI